MSSMERTATKEELEAMAREIREAALEYSRDMQATRAKRHRLFETWTNILDEKKVEQLSNALKSHVELKC
jgi:hypothetical protein